MSKTSTGQAGGLVGASACGKEVTSRPDTKLTARQELFVEAFNGDATGTARRLGLNPNYGRALIAKSHVWAAIQARTAKDSMVTSWGRQNALKTLRDIAEHGEQDKDRIAAIREYATIEGWHIKKIEVDMRRPIVLRWDESLLSGD